MAILTVVTNIIVSTNFNVEILRYEPADCPDGRIGCLVYHCTPIWNPDVWEIVTESQRKELVTLTTTTGKRVTVIADETVTAAERQTMHRVKTTTETIEPYVIRNPSFSLFDAKATTNTTW